MPKFLAHHDEVSKYFPKTPHMWSGFNLIGYLPFWQSLPTNLQEINQSWKDQLGAQLQTLLQNQFGKVAY
jgi:TRAP-type C4-dicarboxylate transport system substrate-binding protein